MIEPFAGSAALSLNALGYGIVSKVTLSDTNEPLMTLWQHIIDNPLALSTRYRELWIEQLPDPRTYFNEIRTLFNQTKDPALFLYLLMRSAKSTIRYNKNGEYNQSPDNRRLGTHPDKVEKNLVQVSAIMQGTKIFSKPYENLILGGEDVLGAAEDAIVYLDPPYQGTSGAKDTRYASGLSREELLVTLEKSIQSNVAFILSYDAVTESNKYGEELPSKLGMERLELLAGRSTHATLLGKHEETVESLYLSPELIRRLN